MKIYSNGRLIQTVSRPVERTRIKKTQRDFAPRNAVGSNQHRTRRKSDYKKILFSYFTIIFLVISATQGAKVYFAPKIISPLPDEQRIVRVAQASEIADVPKVTIIPIKKAVVTPTAIPTMTPTPSELPDIVAYIATVFEPEGKAVVVRAINCFYSESGLRSKAVGHNTDKEKSTDYGVAQLNGYWHKLTEAEKTNYKANIDRAYKIYKGRGGNFSAWYGPLCNK